MNVLIVGAYGLIGSGVARHLEGEGHRVIGLGRDVEIGKRVLPHIIWRAGDLRSLIAANDWHPYLENVDVVVNCSGALQDGPEDNLEAIHHYAVAALADACDAAGIKLIQISAVGAKQDASTVFLASKARGDFTIQKASARNIILRPGLVLSRESYGGTTMLRMLAAIPLIQPLALAEAKIQTVALDDVVKAVHAAIVGDIPEGYVGDLVETEVHSLREVVAVIRHWLGFQPAKREFLLPSRAVNATSTIADGLSRYGWRSPLRSTAVEVLTDGVQGRPTNMVHFGLAPLKSLPETLASIQVGPQDRLFARMALLTPIIIFSLSLFWLLSGVIGLARVRQAALVLEAVGWSTGIAIVSVVFWAFVDIAVGLAFAVRKYARAACLASIGVSAFYLLASTITVPGLWADPLGPLVKIIPVLVLSFVARVALETR